MSEPIRIGLIGIGRAGWGMHCPELEGKDKQFQFVAACDPIASRREKMAERYGCRTYESVEQLVNDPEVELVDIASRSSDHFAQGQLALIAGKDILVEKPFTVTYEEALRLVELSQQYGRRIYVRHNRRFDPDFLHVSEIIANGILGDIHTIKLNRHSYARRDDWQTLKAFGGGQLLNWGPHIIDHSLQLLQSPIKSLWSDLQQIAAAGDAEDQVKIIFQGENGRIVDMEISGGAAISSPTYIVHGTRGSMTLTGSTISLKYLDASNHLHPIDANPGTPGEFFGSSGTFEAKETLAWLETEVKVEPQKSYDFWDLLHQSIREQKEFPIKLEEALEVMRIITEVRKNTRFEQ